MRMGEPTQLASIDLKTDRKASADFSDRSWERWQLADLEVDVNGLRYGGDGIVASLL